jgi:hypothetical protein
MLPAEAGNTSEGRTPADNATVRTVFIVGPGGWKAPKPYLRIVPQPK